MALPLVVRAMVTVVFAATAVLHLTRCLAGSRRRARTGGVARVNDLVHSLMSVEMVAMAWRGPARDQWSLLLTAFAVATGWFLVQAIVPIPLGSVMAGAADVRDLQRRATSMRPSSRTVCARLACLQHAIMAAAMTWMIGVMPAVDEPVAGTAGQMPGMAMSTAAAVSDGGAGRYLGALMGGYLVVSASWRLIAAHRGPSRTPSPVSPRPRRASSLVRRQSHLVPAGTRKVVLTRLKKLVIATISTRAPSWRSS